jgi:amino acid adenylation domain-containing protein
MSSGGPTIGDLSALEKRELLARLLAAQSGPVSISPLSKGQRALWSLHEAFPESAPYNVAFAARLGMNADARLMRESFQVLIDRHPVLRTRIVPTGGEPYQYVDRISTLDHVDHDAATWDADRVAAHLSAAVRRPFELERGSLLRTELLRRGAGADVLLVVMHHIVGDFWSLGVLLDELRAVYSGLRSGAKPALPPLGATYADFVQWQASLLAGAEGHRLWTFWQAELAGSIPVLDLPCDKRRPATQTFEGAEHHFRLPRELTERLRHAANDASSTLYVLLLAAFGCLLQRYSGQDHVLIGVPVSGRARPEFAPIVGYFVNLVPVRVSFDGDPTFRALLERVRATFAGAMAHQDFPFPVLVERLECDRDPARAPLIQAVVNMPRAHRMQGTSRHPFEPTADGISLRLGDVTLEQFPIGQQTSVFELSLTILETADGGLSLTLQYNSDLFEAGTVARMGRHYARLLRDGVERPDSSVSRLRLETDPPPRASAQTVGDEETGPEGHRCVSEMIDLQPQSRPDAIALIDAHGSLTTAALSARSERVAAGLQAIGVRTGDLVGLCFRPGADLIVTMLAVLKAGAAYVPLDPGYPAQRLAAIVRESRPRLVMLDTNLEPMFPDGTTVVHVAECLAGGGQPARLPRPDPDGLAYVIFTSGSTGKPKGVAVSRRNLLYSTRARLAYYDTAPQRFLLLSSPAFDSSVAGIFWALASGGTLSFGHCAHEGQIDPEVVAANIRDGGITHTLCVPSLYAAVLDHLAHDPPSRLGTVIVAGETCSQSLVDRHYRLLPEVTLFNEYGPTEATVWSTVYRCRAGEACAGAPIGEPIRGSRVYLLDANEQPVPAGVPGEISVAGAGVARGYLHRPGLTARAFLPDPFAGPGGRRYRTGDLARWRGGHDLEFLGRADQQIKLRGWRIEPEEIAAVLREHPAVREAVVCCVEQPTGAPAMAAYIESDGAHAAPADEHVDQWRNVYDEAYRHGDAYAASDPAINLAIWTSSYTRAPLGEREILDSVDAVARRILALGPRRVLEIGCGAGLLLKRLAPHCEEYHGWDFSDAALQRAREAVHAHGLRHVTLECRRATEFDGAGGFDAVILNEVVQHFPSLDELSRVLERAAASVGERGFIFIGGVRHLGLLEGFHASVELHRAAASTTRMQLRRRTQQHIARENELFVHPDFFTGLPAVLPAIAGVAVELKRGQTHHEINRFKFDAICFVGASWTRATARERRHWPQSTPDLSHLGEQLSRLPEVLELHGIPNARLIADAQLVDWLHGERTERTAGEIRAGVQPRGAIDPEDLAVLGERHGYAVRLLWAADAWRFDAVFSRTPQPVWCSPPSVMTRPLANDPQRPARTAALVSDLRASLRDRLPAAMVPAHFVVLDRLPRGPNGKLDRRALPTPDDLVTGERADAIAPRTPAEQTLARIWEETLGLPAIGVRDSFFALGGDSILVIQMVARARKAGVEFTPRQVFELETIENLAGLTDRQAPPRTTLSRIDGPVPLTPIQRWFFDRLPARPGACCQGVLLRPATRLNPVAVEASLRAVIAHHDAFGLCFRHVESRWVQTLDSIDASTWTIRRVSGVSDVIIDREMSDSLASIELETAPLIRASLFDEGPGGPGRLLLLAHHLVVDALSWHILVDDLSTAIEQIAQGQPVTLASVPVSFSAWAHELERRAADPVVTYDDTRPGATEMLVVTLPAADTSVLLAASRQAESVEQVLLSALASALTRWKSARRLQIDVERHGRADAHVDLSRTVGWLTTIAPVLLDLEAATDMTAIRREVARQQRAMPPTSTPRHDGPAADVVLNYLGQIDRLIDTASTFRLAPEMEQLRTRLVAPGAYPLSLNVLVAGGRLRAEFAFQPSSLQRGTVERLASDFVDAIGQALAAPEPVHDGLSDAPSYRLTPVQEGLLFYALAEPASSAYFGQLAFRVDGPLDPHALQAAWTSTVERHPVLRTSFSWDAATGPVQRVHPHVRANVATDDLNTVGDDESSALDAFLAVDRTRGFNLGTAPLTRLTVIRVHANRHWIVWSHHHLILDGWSIPIVLADFFAHYRAALAKTRVSSATPRPFGDYVAWLERQDSGRARIFWRRAFDRWTESPLQWSTPRSQEDRAEALLQTASRELVAVARRERLTLNTLAQGAWALVLGHRRSSRDVVFGVTSAGRPFDLDGADQMVGPFINTLPFRVQLPAGERAGAWLRDLQRRQVEMREFEHCPLADVRSWIGASGNQPMFDALMVFENYPVDDLLVREMGPLGVSDLRFTAWNHYPVTLRVVPQTESLLLTLLHDRRAVSGNEAARILSDVAAAALAIARGIDHELGTLERMVAWASPSPEQIEASAHRSAEAMLPGSRRRVVGP